MDRRLWIHSKLQAAIGPQFKVYYQPPPEFKLEYPCIVYNLTRIRTKKADNNLYNFALVYTVTAITTDPDDPLPMALAQIQTAVHDRNFESSGLYHTIFEISV